MNDRVCPVEMEKQGLDVIKKWRDYLLEGNPEKVADLYASDAVFIPTISNDIREGRESIANYFREFLRINPKMEIKEVNLRKYSDGAIGLYGKYVFATDVGVKNALFSFDLVNDEGEWLIEHHHSSMERPKIKY